MGTITEPVTEPSPQSSRTIRKSTVGVALVSVFLALGANTIHLEGKISPESQISARGQRQEFDIAIATDEQDQPGLSTLIMAGSNGLLFDCGLVRGETAPPAVTAVFLTHLQTTTADGLGGARGAACTAPSIRIWGPTGTRKSLLQIPGDQESQDWQRRPFTVVDVQEVWSPRLATWLSPQSRQFPRGLRTASDSKVDRCSLPVTFRILTIS
jgi:hypothetical protein